MQPLRFAAVALAITAVILAIVVLRAPRVPAPPVIAAQGVTLAPGAAERIDGLLDDALRARILPGAEIAVVRGDGTFLIRKAYGVRTLEPQRIANDTSTIYELASMTKPLATASAIMLLVQDGKLRLRDRVATVIPAFGVNAKREVSIAQLLTHTAGVQPDYPRSDYDADRGTILKHAYATRLRFTPGTRFEYSDLGYVVLAEVVARVAHQPFERFVAERLFAPLGMRDSAFDVTLDPSKLSRVAPQMRAQTAASLRRTFGTVPALNGHAGMLSTVDDLARYAVSLLRALGPHPDAAAPLAPATVRAMIEPRYAGGGALRGLGWDLESAYSGDRGDLFPHGGFGHTGSSGTSIWIDPSLDVAVIVLSNAHYPDDIGTTLPLEGKIANVVAANLRGIDPRAVREEEDAFDAAAARSALGFPHAF